jgi:integrase/recombinase XerD
MSNRSCNQQGDRFPVGDHVICYRRGAWWSAEFYSDGHQKRVSLNTKSKKVASRRASRIDAKLVAGIYESVPPNKTIKEVIDLYIGHLRTEDRAASTITRYTPELERWAAFFAKEGVTRISDISLVLVEKYRADRKGEVAAATLYHESILLKQLVTYAYDRGLTTSNPLRKLKLKRPRYAPPETYTLEDVNRIIAAAKDYADLFELLALSGLRIGEARWLTWKDVDLETDGASGVIHVRAKPGEWKPKDGDDRSIPLHPRLVRILALRPRKHRFVFTAKPSEAYPAGGHQISDRHVLASLKRILKRLKIADNTVHAFRHFFVRFCADHGVEPFKLIQWTGHADLRTVLGYYDLNDEASRAAMQRVPFGGDDDGSAGQAQNEHNKGGRKSA